MLKETKTAIENLTRKYETELAGHRAAAERHNEYVLDSEDEKTELRTEITMKDRALKTLQTIEKAEPLELYLSEQLIKEVIERGEGEAIIKAGKRLQGESVKELINDIVRIVLRRIKRGLGEPS